MVCKSTASKRVLRITTTSACTISMPPPSTLAASRVTPSFPTATSPPTPSVSFSWAFSSLLSSTGSTNSATDAAFGTLLRAKSPTLAPMLAACKLEASMADRVVATRRQVPLLRLPLLLRPLLTALLKQYTFLSYIVWCFMANATPPPITMYPWKL